MRSTERGTEAAGETVARQGGGLAEGRDAGFAQCRAGRIIEVDQRQREGRQHVRQARTLDDRVRVAGAREQQRSPRRGREAEAIRVAQRVHAAGKMRHEPRQATEQAEAAADVGDDRIGRGETRHRRERQRQGGELRERARFGIAVAIAQNEMGCERQRARNELLVANAGVTRRGVGRDHARVMPAAADHERTRVVGRRLCARENVERQRGKRRQAQSDIELLHVVPSAARHL